MAPTDVIIRVARRGDLGALGRLGAALLRVHHEFDPRPVHGARDTIPRAATPGSSARSSRSATCASSSPSATPLVVGYIYAAIEPQSWKELRDEAGFIHDVLVDESARGAGVARALLDAAVEWLQSRGVPRVVLWTAHANEPAQRLFPAWASGRR